MFLSTFLKENYQNYRIKKRLMERFPTLSIAPNVHFKGDYRNLKVGENVDLQYGVYLHLGGMDWCKNTGCIEIGSNGVISPYCVLYGGGDGGIHIGNDFNCGPNVGIFASRTDYLKGNRFHKFKAITLGDNVMIGANTVINTGVTVGSNVIISANSFVNMHVPDGVIIAGNPARIVKEYHPTKEINEIDG